MKDTDVEIFDSVKISIKHLCKNADNTPIVFSALDLERNNFLVILQNCVIHC